MIDWPISFGIVGSVVTVGGVWLKIYSDKKGVIAPPHHPFEAINNSVVLSKLAEAMTQQALSDQKIAMVLDRLLDSQGALNTKLDTLLNRQWEIKQNLTLSRDHQ